MDLVSQFIEFNWYFIMYFIIIIIIIIIVIIIIIIIIINIIIILQLDCFMDFKFIMGQLRINFYIFRWFLRLV
jgi:hypothetical protein